MEYSNIKLLVTGYVYICEWMYVSMGVYVSAQYQKKIFPEIHSLTTFDLVS